MRTLAVLAGALLAWGCAARTLPPSGVPVSAPAAPPSQNAPAAPLIPRVEVPAVPSQYILESRGIIASRGDSLARSDTLDTRVALRAVPRGAALDVTINAFSVQPRTGPSQSLPAAVRAVGRFDGAGALAFEGAASACGTLASAALEATRDLWVKWPTQLRVGDQWGDSTSVSLCRDGVPLQLVLIRRYVVTADSGSTSSRILTIDRRSHTTLQGRGSIRGDSTTLTGEGTGSATLRLSPNRGWLVDGNGTSTLRLTARGTRRTQTVTQGLTMSFRQVADTTRFP